MTTWGISATIKAPADEILRFAAYHLEKGAHRLFIYLDEENPSAFEALSAHPKVRVTKCDDAWWLKRRKQRPEMHQARQTANATHAYRRRAELDWLIHMDVDEFLICDQHIGTILATLPGDTPLTRIRPMESLSGGTAAFKRFIPGGPDRDRIVTSLYPTYGLYTKGGFLSHLAGKVFVRTGLPDVTVKIHNAFQNGEQITGIDDQPGIELAHMHAKTWDDWRSSYQYRLTKGSYRAELGPNKPHEKGGLSMHELFTMIEKEDGEEGLRAFFEEVSADTPGLRARLDAHGLLALINLDLDSPMRTHFPNVNP
ncbi:glycosyltransferase family 2 protein [Sulfitobacter sp. MF3-043]|uniref:glycosyltransferase family 2 protein n=1 Tax=Sulfitobacter sediminivivens TaxID=3252902 RepID=UPI0036D9C426